MYRTIHLSLIHPHGHLSVIKHPSQFILQGQHFLCKFLIQNVNLMLYKISFPSHLLITCSPGILDFGTELRTCCAEEVGFLQVVLVNIELRCTCDKEVVK